MRYKTFSDLRSGDYFGMDDDGDRILVECDAVGSAKVADDSDPAEYDESTRNAQIARSTFNALVHMGLTMRYLALSALICALGHSLAAEIQPADLPEIKRIDDQACAYLYRAGGDRLSQQLHNTPAARAGACAEAVAWFAELDRMGTLERPGVRLYRFLRETLRSSQIYAAWVDDPFEPAQEAATLPQIAGQHVALITPDDPDVLGLRIALRELGKTTDASEMRDNGDNLTIAYDDWKLHLRKQGDNLLIATTREAIEAVSLPPDQSLAASEFFQSAVTPLLAGQERLPIGLYYYDLRPLWQPLQGDDFKLWNDISWRGIEALSGATFVKDGRFLNRHYWKLGVTRTGLLRKIESHPLRRDWFRAVPEDASLVVSGVWRAGSFLASMQLAGEWLMGSENAIASNLNLPRELAPLLMNLQSSGSRYLLYRRSTSYSPSFFMQGISPSANMVMLVELEDPDYFVESLEALTRLPSLSLQPAQRHQNGQVAVTMVPLAFIPLYATSVGDIGILTTNGQLMKDAIEHVQRVQESENDSATPLIAFIKTVPEDACFVGYSPPGGILRELYEHYAAQVVEAPGIVNWFSTVGSFFGDDSVAAPGTGTTFDVFAIPRGLSLARHAKRATTMIGRDVEHGILFEGASDLLASPLIITHLHALTRFHPKPIVETLGELYAWMMMPAERIAAEADQTP
jgi:hypothetical protein